MEISSDRKYNVQLLGAGNEPDFVTNDLEVAMKVAAEYSNGDRRSHVTTLLRKGVYGYADTSRVVANFRNGVDLSSLSVDEDCD